MPLIEEVHSSDDEVENVVKSRFTRPRDSSDSSSSSFTDSDSDSSNESSGSESSEKNMRKDGVMAAAAEHRTAKTARARTQRATEGTKAKSGSSKAIWIGLAVIVIGIISLRFFEGIIRFCMFSNFLHELLFLQSSTTMLMTNSSPCMLILDCLHHPL